VAVDVELAEREKGRSDYMRRLAQALRCVRAAGWVPASVDATIVAQAPKMAPHIPAMRASGRPRPGMNPRPGEVPQAVGARAQQVGGEAVAQCVCALARCSMPATCTARLKAR